MISHQVRVRYAETDQMGVAHHAAYVPWLEEARIAWLRSQGHSYKDLEAAGTMMPVVELAVRYKRPARFDEILTLETAATASGPSRIRFQTRVVRGADLLAEAEVTVATVGSDGRPQRIPAGLQPLLVGPA